MSETLPDVIREKSGGVGIHWSATLTRESLPGVVAYVRGSASGYIRTATWYADLAIPVPAERNRKPPPLRGNYVAGYTPPPPDRVVIPISQRLSRAAALLDAHEALKTWDIEAKLDERIEAMWESDYRARCLDYLHLNHEQLWEHRVDMIRAMRGRNPAFAALFPEPPAREG